MASFNGGILLPGTSAQFTINDAYYLVGGDKGAAFSNSLWAYNMSNRWDAMQAFPGEALKWQTAVALNNIGYVFGGRDAAGTASSGMFRYLPSQNQWDQVMPSSAVATWPSPRYWAAGSAFSGAAWFIGGNDGTILKEVWRFDGTAWSKATDLPVAQYGGIAVTANNSLYAGLGLTNTLGASFNNRLYVLTQGASNWTEETRLPSEAGQILQAVAYGNNIYMTDSNGTIWLYSISSKGWTRKSTLPISNRGNYQHSMFVFGGYIYIGFGSSYQSLLRYAPTGDN
jgi:hypothetical protein